MHSGMEFSCVCVPAYVGAKGPIAAAESDREAKRWRKWKTKTQNIYMYINFHFYFRVFCTSFSAAKCAKVNGERCKQHLPSHRTPNRTQSDRTHRTCIHFYLIWRAHTRTHLCPCLFSIIYKYGYILTCRARLRQIYPIRALYGLGR